MSYESLKSLEWLSPWGPVSPAEGGELRAEALIENPLLPEEITVVGRRSDCDDVLLLLPAEETAFAVLHLTRGEAKDNARRNWPVLYASLWDWVENCMIPANAVWEIHKGRVVLSKPAI